MHRNLPHHISGTILAIAIGIFISAIGFMQVFSHKIDEPYSAAIQTRASAECDDKIYTSFQDAFSNPQKVCTLVLLNPATGILPQITTLTNLKSLTIEYPHLTDFPIELTTLRKLKELHVHNTQITYLPDSIDQLVNLEILDLANNRLTTIPETTKSLKNLKILILRGNPLSNSTIQRIRQGLLATTIDF